VTQQVIDGDAQYTFGSSSRELLLFGTYSTAMLTACRMGSIRMMCERINTLPTRTTSLHDVINHEVFFSKAVSRTCQGASCTQDQLDQNNFRASIMSRVLIPNVPLVQVRAAACFPDAP